MGGEDKVVEMVVAYPILLGRKAVPLSRTVSFRDPRPGEEPSRNECDVTGTSEPVFPAARV